MSGEGRIGSKITIGVTGMNATDNPAPGIGVIRCLLADKTKNFHIVGMAYDVYDTGIYDEGLLDDVYLVPFPNEGAENLLNRIKKIHSDVKLDVIIPTLDSELRVYQQIEKSLNEMGIALLLPSVEKVELRSKMKLSDFCEKNKINTPKTIVLRSTGEIEKAIEELSLPLVIKGIFYEAFICKTVDDVFTSFHKIANKWGLPIIAQEFLHGNEYDICCVGNRDGKLIGAVPIRKIGLTDKGKAWSAVTIADKKLMALSEKTIEALGWVGPCELEFLKDEKTGEFYLLEINPRFPAWIFLSSGVEQNLPIAAVKIALGEDIPKMQPAKSGVTFVRHATDMICQMERIEKLTIYGELHFGNDKL
ncbi:ATP-grasp domain-containing protein [bacterium]|nr:ATP-grasp domain-containing protein [bacterium]